MNLELDSICNFYDFVVSKKPAGWTAGAFWSLVADIHFESKVFKDPKRQTPVKIPLKVGDLLLMVMQVILVWAQVAGRNAEGVKSTRFFFR